MIFGQGYEGLAPTDVSTCLSTARPAPPLPLDA